MATAREELRLQVIGYTCSQNCMGFRGNSGGCCTLDDRDFIPGPVRDADAFLADLRRVLGREVTRQEVFIDLEEGRTLFPDRPMLAGTRELPGVACPTGRGVDSVPVLRSSDGCVHRLRHPSGNVPRVPLRPPQETSFRCSTSTRRIRRLHRDEPSQLRHMLGRELLEAGDAEQPHGAGHTVRTGSRRRDRTPASPPAISP